MNHAIRNGLTAAALLVFAGAAGAQDRYRGGQDRGGRDHDWYHTDRDDRYRDNRWRARLFWHVREDLEHVQFATFPIGRDQYRIQRTKNELNELQDKLARGVYDQRQLDFVIMSLERVVADNRMSVRDREVLNDDVRRMREYRDHHEGWGR